MRWILTAIAILQTAAVWAVPQELQSQIQQAAHRFRIDPRLVEAIIEVESGPLGETATSPKGARGLMQVMPLTADDLGIANSFHPLSNLMGACEYLRTLLNRFQFDLPKVLAAYNAGPAKVERYGGIPPYKETQAYVRKVLAAYERKRAPR